MELRLLDTGLMTGAENMALDAIILEEVEAGLSPPTMRFLRFDPPAVLVGHNQDLAEEVRPEYCRDQGIEINRRLTGGGAILFEPAMLGVELFLPLSGRGPGGDFASLSDRLGRMFAAAVSRLGASAQYRPRNDIEIDGRKVSGLGLAYLSRAVMFQGTLLIENCLDRMLRSLRVPVEKLERREIRSLLQRVTFLEDELGRRPEMEAIKAAFQDEFGAALGAELIPGGLTDHEQGRLADEIGYYRSADWVRRRRVTGPASDVLRSRSGRMSVALWADLKRRRIKQALITGDFFARPNRLVYDLESALKGASLKPDKLAREVERFLDATEGEFVGLSRERIITAVTDAAAKGSRPWPGFTVEELNRIQPVGADLSLEGWTRPQYMLLPYCAKDLNCPVRHVDDCTRCGLCPIGDMYDLADKLGLEPISISSFEHLMVELKRIKKTPQPTYVASCCQAFLAKHQTEMAEEGPPGIIVDVDSLTCYDLGKEEQAYVGRFNRQSTLLTDLLAKTSRFLAEGDSAGEGAPEPGRRSAKAGAEGRKDNRDAA